jgi:hypothetical protein
MYLDGEVGEVGAWGTEDEVGGSLLLPWGVVREDEVGGSGALLRPGDVVCEDEVEPCGSNNGTKFQSVMHFRIWPSLY